MTLRFAPLAVVVTTLLAGPAWAVPVMFTVAEEFESTPVEATMGSGISAVGLTGTFVLDPEGLKDTTLPLVAATDLDLALQLEVTIGSTVTPYTLDFTSDNAFLEFNPLTTSVQGDMLVIDGSGQPPGTPLLQFTGDTLSTPVELGNGFPNGRRFGTTDLDTFVAAFSTGSVNIGVAAFEDGLFNPPGALALGEVSPDDSIMFASAAAPMAPVPLPAGLWLMLGWTGALLAWSRRRARHPTVAP